VTSDPVPESALWEIPGDSNDVILRETLRKHGCRALAAGERPGSPGFVRIIPLLLMEG
jgi:hypothetical protein